MAEIAKSPEYMRKILNLRYKLNTVVIIRPKTRTKPKPEAWQKWLKMAKLWVKDKY